MKFDVSRVVLSPWLGREVQLYLWRAQAARQEVFNQLLRIQTEVFLQAIASCSHILCLEVRKGNSGCR